MYIAEDEQSEMINGMNFDKDGVDDLNNQMVLSTVIHISKTLKMIYWSSFRKERT